VPLLEILLLVGVLSGLVWFASNAMRKARQRAVLAILQPRGISGEFDASGWLTGLDARGIPDDQFSLTEFRSLRDIPVLNLDHTEASDKDLVNLPSGIGLKRLTLVATAVSDAGCGDLAGHADLTHLDVRLTFVADEGVAKLATLRNLEQLRLAQTWVTDSGLKPLRRLPRLMLLDLRDTAVTDEGLRILAESKSLKQLLLKNSDVTSEGVASLQSARPDLKIEYSPEIDESVRVEFREPNFVDTEPLEFRTVVEGEIYDTLTNGPFPMTSLHFGYVKAVHVHKWEKMNDSQMESFQKLRRLEWLGVEHTAVTDAGVAHLMRNRMLSQVSLDGTKVTDEGLRPLTKLPRLTHLWLGGLPITENGVRILRDARHLWWLGLNETCLTPDALRQLKSLALRSLEIRNAGLGPAELEALSELTTLRHLDVSRNAFLGPGLRHLAKLKSLTYLDLSQTAVTDQDAETLLKFPDTLRDVVLTRSRVSQSVLEKLRASGREWEITMVIPKVEKD